MRANCFIIKFALTKLSIFFEFHPWTLQIKLLATIGNEVPVNHYD